MGLRARASGRDRGATRSALRSASPARVVTLLRALGARALPLLLVVGACAVGAGCGYTAVHDVEVPRLHVALVHAGLGDAVASDEVVSGVREGLARDGALAAGGGYPRVEIEVLRADEAAEGIRAVTPLPGEREVPRATGSDVGVVARAWIVRAAGGPHEADTGDMRAASLVATPDDGAPSTEVLRHDDALRATARRLGTRLAARILGHPVAREELVGD